MSTTPSPEPWIEHTHRTLRAAGLLAGGAREAVLPLFPGRRDRVSRAPGR